MNICKIKTVTNVDEVGYILELKSTHVPGAMNLNSEENETAGIDLERVTYRKLSTTKKLPTITYAAIINTEPGRTSPPHPVIIYDAKLYKVAKAKGNEISKTLN